VGLGHALDTGQEPDFLGRCAYFRLDQNSPAPRLTPSAPKPATVYEFKDQDAVSLQVRAQRNF